MPFEISGAINKERTLHTEVEVEGVNGALPLDYFPGHVGEVQRKLQAQQATPKVDRYDDLVEAFLALVAKWDVVNNGVPVPLTPEGLESIGMESVLLGNIVNAVISESYAGEATGTRLRKRL
jgi:hypothetical protein